MTERSDGGATPAYRPVPLDFERLPEPEMRRRATELVAEMRRRRSVRRFSTDPVPRELIEAALEVAGTAPSGAHRQPWRFVVVLFKVRHGQNPDGSIEKHYYATESCGIAAGFLIAALHRMGLATLPHTPSPMAFLSEVLERPAEEQPFLVLPVGYPADDAEVPDLARKPVADIVEWR